MKYLNGVAVCCLGSILFLSCQEQFEEDSERQEGQQLPMSVIAQIGVIHNEPTPRYSGEVGSAIFAEGDKIGMFVDDNPVTEWTYSLKWTSPKAYWDDLVTESTLSAFYPYNDATTDRTKVCLPSLKGQDGSWENIQKYDFMVAEVTQAYGEDGTVAFTGNNSFRHISCLVQFDIKAAGTLSDAVLTNLSLEGGNIISSATYSFETEKVTLTQEGDSDLLSVSLNNHSMADEKEGVSYYFILNQKTSDTPVSLTLEYSVAGKSYAASISTFAKDNAFKEGTHQKYNIAVNGKEIQITGGEIGSWNDGGEMGDINLDVKTGDEENK